MRSASVGPPRSPRLNKKFQDRFTYLSLHAKDRRPHGGLRHRSITAPAAAAFPAPKCGSEELDLFHDSTIPKTPASRVTFFNKEGPQHEAGRVPTLYYFCKTFSLPNGHNCLRPEFECTHRAFKKRAAQRLGERAAEPLVFFPGEVSSSSWLVRPRAASRRNLSACSSPTQRTIELAPPECLLNWIALPEEAPVIDSHISVRR